MTDAQAAVKASEESYVRAVADKTAAEQSLAIARVQVDMVNQLLAVLSERIPRHLV